MHIAEGFLPPVHAIGWTVAAAPFVVSGFRAIKHQLDDRPEDKIAIAASGAFAFALSAMKIPSVNGSSAHPTGVGLGAVLFRPRIMAALGFLVLVFQALILAHGGLTTLGANTFSMAIVGPFVSYAVFRLLRRRGVALGLSAGVGAGIGSWSTYCVTALQLAWAHPDVTSGFVGSLAKFLGIFAITQLPLSVVEGCISAWVVRWMAARSTFDLDAFTGTGRPVSPGRISAAWMAFFGVILVAVGPVMARFGATFLGSDDRAKSAVNQIDPGYRPWAHSFWVPPTKGVEVLLFAVQALAGASLVAYALASRRRTNPSVAGGHGVEG